MIGDAVLSNPIWWGQFRLMGGAGRVGIRTGLYAGFVLLAFLAANRLSRAPVSVVADRALYFAGLAQLIMILPWWGSRIHKAVVSDTEGKMMESHRLSPMTGLSAVLGYMIGPGLQIACLCLVNLIAGVVFCALSGTLMTVWLTGHVYILFVAAFVWSGTALGSLCLGKGASLIPFLFVLLILPTRQGLELIPGLGLICGTEMIGYCYSVAVGGGSSGLPAGVGWSLAVQILVILLWLRGAARKFERPDLPAFSVEWASLMYAGWLVVAVVGLDRAKELKLPLTFFAVKPSWQLAATLVASLVFLIVPLRSAAIESQRWLEQHRELAGDKPLAPTLVGLVLALATAILLAWLPAWSEYRRFEPGVIERLFEVLLWTTAGVVLVGVSLAALYRTACAARLKKIDTPVIIYVILVWAALPIADSIIQAYQEAASLHYEAHLTALTACSPAGGLIAVWRAEPLIIWEGLVFHAALCLGLVVLELRTVRAARARRAAVGRLAKTSG